MTLLEDYNSITEDRRKSVAQALISAATDMLLILTTVDPDYAKKAKFARYGMQASSKSVIWLVRAMVSQGVDVDNDNALKTAISGNFDKLAAMYDPTLEA